MQSNKTFSVYVAKRCFYIACLNNYMFRRLYRPSSGCTLSYYGPGSSVGIANDYRLDGPGSNPGADEIFRPSRPALGPTQPPVKWVLGLPRG